MKRPSLENLTTRALFEALPLWPSETKMSPFAAIDTPVGRSKVSVPLPPTPILPSIINTLPFWSSLLSEDDARGIARRYAEYGLFVIDIGDPQIALIGDRE